MGQQKKNNTSPSVKRYSLQGCERRPVKKSDKWCYIPSRLNGNMDNSPAPYGFIVTIPFLPNQNTQLEDVGGIIIRSKKHCGNFLLQIVLGECRLYGIGSSADRVLNLNKKKRKNKKRLFRTLNTRNCNKSTNIFGEYIW